MTYTDKEVAAYRERRFRAVGIDLPATWSWSEMPEFLRRAWRGTAKHRPDVELLNRSFTLDPIFGEDVLTAAHRFRRAYNYYVGESWGPVLAWCSWVTPEHVEAYKHGAWRKVQQARQQYLRRREVSVPFTIIARSAA